MSDTVELDESDPLNRSLMARFGAETAADVMYELRQGLEVEKVLAGIRQRRVAAAMERLEHHTVDGLGQHTHRVDMTAFLYWHARTNGECWKDDTFWKEYGRDNPEVKVAYSPRCATIIHPGLPKPEPLIQLTGLDSFGGKEGQ